MEILLVLLVKILFFFPGRNIGLPGDNINGLLGRNIGLPGRNIIGLPGENIIGLPVGNIGLPGRNIGLPLCKYFWFTWWKY